MEKIKTKITDKLLVAEGTVVWAAGRVKELPVLNDWSFSPVGFIRAGTDLIGFAGGYAEAERFLQAAPPELRVIGAVAGGLLLGGSFDTILHSQIPKSGKKKKAGYRCN